MLFKKINNFSEPLQTNCIIKPTSDPAHLTFKDGLWYVWLCDSVDLLDGELDSVNFDNARFIELDSDDKFLVEMSSNGSNDGFVDARNTEIALTVSSPAIIFLICQSYYGEFE